MNREHVRLLVRCLELTLELAANEPPEWATWDYRPWREQRDFGPRYRIAGWFGPQRERDRVKFRRALDDLEDAGLVVLNRVEGIRLTNVALTAAGRQRAEQLTAEAAADA
jgi:hypothetical protein